MLVPLLILSFCKAAMACYATLPNVQFVVRVNNASPPLVQVFNVPLFDSDCFYQIPAKPINTDGQFVPSEAVSAQFVLDSFVDPTGNSLDQTSLSTLSAFIGGYLGVGTEIDVPGIFELGLVVCSLESRTGSRIILGGHSTNTVQFEDQISVKSYQCCIDYNGDSCGF